MHLLLLSVIAFSLIAAARAVSLDAEWRLFKVTKNKQYPTKSHELARRAIWKSNLVRINKHNLRAQLGQETYEVGMNHLGDLTVAEIQATFLGLRPRLSRNSTLRELFVSSPPKGYGCAADADHVDWRSKGIVTPVKNQGQCGSCWAFSAIGALEGQHALKTSALVSLSEQELVDCAGDQGNNGCSGGTLDGAFQYIKLNKGVDTEDAYPYTATDGQCHPNRTSIGATLNGFVDIASKNETDLTRAIAEVGPISVAIEAGFGFSFYKSGIFYDSDCSDDADKLNHGVLAVGYGDNQNENGKYYIVKNSWGDTWGEGGYLKMSRDRNNNCGIATQASYPKV